MRFCIRLTLACASDLSSLELQLPPHLPSSLYPTPPTLDLRPQQLTRQVKELGVSKETAEEALRTEKDVTKALVKLTAPGRR